MFMCMTQLSHSVRGGEWSFKNNGSHKILLNFMDLAVMIFLKAKKVMKYLFVYFLYNCI